MGYCACGRPLGRLISAAGHVTAPEDCGHCSIKEKLVKKEVPQYIIDALQFYAGPHKYPHDGPWGINSDDYGIVAQQALERLAKE